MKKMRLQNTERQKHEYGMLAFQPLLPYLETEWNPDVNFQLIQRISRNKYKKG